MRPGQTTAIIGATGSGKSTLVNLIPRLFAPTSGKVVIGGVDVASMPRVDLARHVGLVPQKAYLFSGTVASNLRFGNQEATDEELWDALRVAQGEDFVRHRGTGEKAGLASPIAQGGTDVSGGQRQRLCIARALVAKPSVYVFDDSFSALDVRTDAALRTALRPTVQDAAVVTVAQRVSTIRDADQILVLDKGTIIARGSHDELLDSSSTYREIVESQMEAQR